MGNTPLRGLLLDTHIWLWYLARPELVPANFRTAIEDNATACWLSAISVWEAVVLMEKDRFKVTIPGREWIQNALERFPVDDAHVSREVALLSREVDLPHQDPADRFISATALIYELTLLTVDKRLLAARWLPTMSPR